MKRLTIVPLIILLALLGCGGSGLQAEQVGYYKGDNNLRYYTFNISGYEGLTPGSPLPAELKAAIEAHGKNRMNTAGKITASFYYASGAPDITTLDATQANDLAHSRRPLMSVWIMPNGEVNVFEDPGTEE